MCRAESYTAVRNGYDSRMPADPDEHVLLAKRGDAARNRTRLLAAARAAFAAHGHDVALEEIARAANVSRTTLYRNFATREDLAATIYAEGLDLIERRAAELAGSPYGVIDLFEFLLDLQASSGSITPVLSRSDAAVFAGLTERTAAAFQPLVEEGVRSGVLRPGIELHDLLLAILMGDMSAGGADSELRAEQHMRSRMILRRGLFTDHALAAWKPPAAARASASPTRPGRNPRA
ncbi:TetR family transcriptional regulator [Sphaerisporangium krabiense]|nr:TetR family transcriptional regulator [Sphaerisporangium krabiense]